MFIKLFKPTLPSQRNKKIVTSTLSSPSFLKNLRYQFFKKKIFNKHKFLNHTNSIFKLNFLKSLCGVSILVNWFKVSYKNTFLGFFEFSDNAICIKSLHYGFSYTNTYTNYFMLDTMSIYTRCNFFLQNKLQRLFLFFFDINFKLFSLMHQYGNGIYCTSAGTFCQVIDIDFFKKTILLKLPSKQFIFFDFLATAIIGRASNIYSAYAFYSTYSSRYSIKHKKQSVRGIAKNPIDHPNGGRSKIKTPFLNPWGCIAKYGK